MREEKEKLLQKRASVFYQSLVPFVEEYGKKVVREFYNYWSEPNTSKTKLRFELEKTWDTNRRLATWANRERPRGGMSTGIKLDTGEMNYDKSSDWG